VRTRQPLQDEPLYSLDRKGSKTVSYERSFLIISSYGELVGMIRGGRITCGMTMAALALLTAGGNMNCP
jgi:hypothetical protein